MAKTIMEIRDWFAAEEAAIRSRRFGITGEAHTQAESEIDSGIAPDLQYNMSAEGRHNLKIKIAQDKAKEIRQDARNDLDALHAAYAEMLQERLGEVRLELFKEARNTSPETLAQVSSLGTEQLKSAMRVALDTGNLEAGDLYFAEAHSRDDAEAVAFYADRRAELDPEGWGALFEELSLAESITPVEDVEARFEALFGAEPGVWDFRESVSTGQ